MKSVNILLLVFMSAFCLLAQQKAVHFKKLQEFLPAKEIQGWQRSKPTGSTNTIAGMATSVATVQYEDKSVSENQLTPLKSMEISITDVSFTPFVLMAFNMLQGYESETENGYEKGLTIKERLKGKVEVRTESENKSVDLQLAIGECFLLTIHLDGSDDFTFIEKILDEMNLSALSELKSE
ncbi:MAG: hypothetical protein Q8Q47_05735 [Ignavibacteriaceae bacterium]|nr:hypothetical protein [Ignavibacteriaceae bacterium]